MPLKSMTAALVVLATIPWAHAIPEGDYEQTFRSQIAPFLQQGEKFTFPSADGRHQLSGICFRNPEGKGLIVVVNGRSESWLKYGELFHDLYGKGYSIASYDHRGQGLSPRLLPQKPRIGEIDSFDEYSRDLGAFLERLKNLSLTHHGKTYLLAHSMGAAVAIDYLREHPAAFRAAAFTAPMLRINTTPYPEAVATLVVRLLHAVGLGAAYAPGEHDRDPEEPFETNRITTSRARWQAIQELWNKHPEAVVGGPSNDWVLQTLLTTPRIREAASSLQSPTLILQSGQDRLVINEPAPQGPNISTLTFPDARHEILMERDLIRDQALGEILGFFAESTPP
jgi:lysophospholipase